MKNKNKLPEAGQYGSKHELLAMAKVEPEAGQQLCRCDEVPEAHLYLCHAELVSASKSEKTLKRVQGDKLPEARQLKSRIATLTTFARNDRKRAAFTLAEVLITLGIIGVVAAMTIPTLIQKHEEKVTVTKVKKMYSTLSQAYLMNKAQDEIVLDRTNLVTDSSTANDIAKVFVPYLKIAKDCSTTTDRCNLSQTYKYLKLTGNSSIANAYKIILQDGSSLFFIRTRNGSPSGPFYADIIYYDVNGSKEPNVYGKDLFMFQIVKDRILPMGDVGTTFRSDCRCVSGAGYGFGCAEWVIKNGNMDYLHCNDLSWNGKHSCK